MDSFVAYEEAALLWEQSLTWEKRYTAGTRLVQELTGAAKRLVAGRDAGWVAFRGGVTILMDHLRKALGKPRVNEVTDLLATYFKGCKRKSQESMNEYVTRKFEAYFRASQALKRVAPHYETESMATATGENWHLVYVAAILAYKLDLRYWLVTCPNMAGLSSMTKSDMILVLRTYGEEPPTAWTRVDLRHRIDEL
ncbi:unnamed protein product, partial [Symbiodinium pilosum]